MRLTYKIQKKLTELIEAKKGFLTDDDIMDIRKISDLTASCYERKMSEEAEPEIEICENNIFNLTVKQEERTIDISVKLSNEFGEKK